MRVKFIVAAAVLAAMLAFSGVAQATYLVDTGTPTGNIFWTLGNAGTSNQWLGGQFTVSTASNVANIEGYIAGSGGGPVTIVLANDAAGLPGSSIWSGSFQAVISGPGAWQGVNVPNVGLSAGTYWALFEAGSSTIASMPDAAPSPLPLYAFSLDDGGAWPTYALDMGVRLDDTAHDYGTAPVPEPCTMLLLGGGLFGLGALKRKKS